ncbi:hypothetical protein AUJ65_03475 [Candidatus Micrarchaeota archaeon CG1_02_51_15]|nr:MAG: hypothetical protein AUJ65_03475 [Candidatus Micrarchaeota archaeon CG1_02_51_15]
MSNYLKKNLNREDPLIRFAKDHSNEHGFVFGDQIEIRRQHARSSLGTDLMNRFYADMRNKKISRACVSVLHKPTRNTASIAFCKDRLGMHDIGEVQNHDRTTWGIYHRKLE